MPMRLMPHTFVAAISLLFPALLHAQSPWTITGRYHLAWARASTRIGDIQGVGVVVRRSVSERWSLTASVDHYGYDLETPVFVTGVRPRPSDEPVDAFVAVTRGEAGARYYLRDKGRWTPYVSGGLGFYAISPGDASGNTNMGGTFSLDIHAPPTFGASAGVGTEWRVGGHGAIGMLLSYAYTTTRYTVRERVSNTVGRISPYAPFGVSTEISFRF
jgi:hypothetical protein